MTGPAEGRKEFFEGPVVKGILAFLSIPPLNDPPLMTPPLDDRSLGQNAPWGGHLGGVRVLLRHPAGSLFSSFSFPGLEPYPPGGAVANEGPDPDHLQLLRLQDGGLRPPHARGTPARLMCFPLLIG